MNITNIEASYDRLAVFYNILNSIFFMGTDKMFRTELVRYLRLKSDNYVLDLCCGTGLNFSYLQKFIKDKGRIVGTDISLKMLQKAKKKIKNSNFYLLRADINHLPFRKNSFDAITISFCLKISPLMKENIKEVTKVLKPKSMFGILSNHKPDNIFSTFLTLLLNKIFKINYNLNIEEFIKKNFRIIKNDKKHGSLVQLLIAIKKSC